MYSRNYFDSDAPTSAVPENYVGNAFQVADVEPKRDEEESVPTAASQSQTHRGGLLASLNLPFLDSLRLPEIGSEELLIIAVALFLLFSQNGDKECAVMLLLLLLVN